MKKLNNLESLNNQVQLHSLDTSAFYNADERIIADKMNVLYYRKNEIIKLDKIYKSSTKKLKAKLNRLKVKSCKTMKVSSFEVVTKVKNKSWAFKNMVKYNNTKTIAELNQFPVENVSINNQLDLLKVELKSLLSANTSVRALDASYLEYVKNDNVIKKNVISIFDSALTRALGIKENELTTDLFIVQTFYFEVIEDLILNGFMYNNEKYSLYTASAGQIRTKKTVFIKDSTLAKVSNTLMCGLSVSDINAYGGINRNKYLAYLALSNSATTAWEGFDINKCIVVDDLATDVFGTVDYIEDINYTIERKDMNIPIEHTDGAGMILPSVCKKNFMFRLPWVKGLLISFDYKMFISDNGCSPTVKDIYGVEHNVIDEGIEIIFTKSQFKLWSYYKSWNEYKENFIKYNCEASICNMEDDYIGKASLNYQMFQTLTDLTDDELRAICGTTNDRIKNIGSDQLTIQQSLGLTSNSKFKSNQGKCLEAYLPLFNEACTKNTIKTIKESMVKDAYAGKVKVDGKYTFASPDMYAFCEFLFMGVQKPNGLLNSGEVSCRLYKNTPELDCLRSPHLGFDYGVRSNIINDKISKYFTTDACYMSCNDLLSKWIMNDWDGDKLLVIADKTIIEATKRNIINKDLVPLYYNMPKADKTILSNISLFDGLKKAYTSGNIGIYSNNISKILNSSNGLSDDDIKVIKLLVMENNMIIDSAKSMYTPTRPTHINLMIQKATKGKLPHFFKYAKDKEDVQVEEKNNSVVNRLLDVIVNSRLNFKNITKEKFKYQILMNDNKTKIEADIIERVIELYDTYNETIHLELKELKKNSKYPNYNLFYSKIKSEFIKIANINIVVDILVKELFVNRDSEGKKLLYEVFGETVLENINKNVKLKNTYCECCGLLITKKSNKTKYCDECGIEVDREKAKNRMKSIRCSK